MTHLRLIALSLAALGMITVAGCDDNDNNNTTSATLHVQNNSDFAIVEIHVTSVGSTTWGSNLLSGPLQPGQSLTLGVSCGTFDALLVDEQGVDCQLHNVDLCLNQAAWVINNTTCTVFGAAKAAGEANDAATPATH